MTLWFELLEEIHSSALDFTIVRSLASVKQALDTVVNAEGLSVGVVLP